MLGAQSLKKLSLESMSVDESFAKSMVHLTQIEELSLKPVEKVFFERLAPYLEPGHSLPKVEPEALNSVVSAIMGLIENKPLDALAQKFGQAKYISKPVRSSGEGDESDWLTADMLSQAFNTGQGEWVEQTMRVPQGFAVVRVEKIIPASEDEFKNKKAEITREAEAAKGGIRFARWMASVRDRHEITTNQQALDRY